MRVTRFSAIIIDDEPLAAEGLRQFCERSKRVEIVGEARDASCGLALIAALRPEAVFLDIAMPGMTGLELATRLQQEERPPKVVLVTAHDHYATEAFDLAVTDYVLKPLVHERLDRAIERVADAIAVDVPAARARELWVPHRGTVVRLELNTVHRVEAERDYVRLHDAHRSYLLRATITDLMSRLDPGSFVRVHRSTIIALDRIAGVRHIGAGAWVICDPDGVEHRIGRSYLNPLRERLGLKGEQ